MKRRSMKMSKLTAEVVAFHRGWRGLLRLVPKRLDYKNIGAAALEAGLQSARLSSAKMADRSQDARCEIRALAGPSACAPLNHSVLH